MSTATPQPSTQTAYALAFRETMLAALAEEMKTTSRVIRAVPDARSDYRPDPKSRTAAELAWHIASEDVIIVEQIVERRFGFPDTRYDAERPATHTALADWYEKRFSAALEKVRAIPTDKLVEPIDFIGLLNWPAFMYLLLANNHSIHHRGQLSSYLRAMGSKVPSIYGPTADDSGM